MLKLASNYMKYMANIEISSQNTLRAYGIDLEQYLNHLIPCKKDPMGSVNPIFCQFQPLSKSQNTVKNLTNDKIMAAAKNSMNDWAHLSSASRNRKVATLKSFFKWMFQKGHINSPLHEKLISPKVARKLPHFISVDEALSLIQAHEREYKNTKSTEVIRDLVLILAMYGGGLRVSEACEIEKKHIRKAQLSILVLGKGGRERLATMPAICFKYIDILLKESPKSHKDRFGAKP